MPFRAGGLGARGGFYLKIMESILQALVSHREFSAEK